MGSIIESLARSIAQAQFDLDRASTQVAQMMAGQRVQLPSSNGVGTREVAPIFLPMGKWADGSTARFSLMELGFTPNFGVVAPIYLDVSTTH